MTTGMLPDPSTASYQPADSAAGQPPPQPDAGSADSWHQAWAHRDALLRVARSRSLNHADAEDAVAEALVRSHEDNNVDFQRVGAWLTTVTVRLCADSARDRARHSKRLAYQLRQGVAAVDHGPDICDRAEANWVARQMSALPERQRRALELRAQGADIASVAAQMQVSYRVADGLLQRAKAHMRAVLATSAAWLIAAIGLLNSLLRRRASEATVGVAVVSTALIVGIFDASQQNPEASPGPVSRAALTDGSPRLTLAARPPAPPSGTRTPRVADDAAAQRPAQLPETSTSLAVATRPSHTLRAASATVTDGGSSYERREQSFLQSVEECLRDGIQVSPGFVGCQPE